MIDFELKSDRTGNGRVRRKLCIRGKPTSVCMTSSDFVIFLTDGARKASVFHSFHPYTQYIVCDFVLPFFP